MMTLRPDLIRAADHAIQREQEFLLAGQPERAPIALNAT